MASRGGPQALIVVLCGPGGVGKGTIVQKLLGRDERLWLSRSWTTRRPRPAEPADAYTFVNRATFEARAGAGGFLEWAPVLGELYGTPTPDPPAGSDVVLEIDVQGASQVLDRCDDVVCILIVPPSEDAQFRRLIGRGDSEARAAERVALGRREVEAGRSIAGHVVVNDDLERAVGEVVAILGAERRARAAGLGAPTPSA